MASYNRQESAYNTIQGRVRQQLRNLKRKPNEQITRHDEVLVVETDMPSSYSQLRTEIDQVKVIGLLAVRCTLMLFLQCT